MIFFYKAWNCKTVVIEEMQLMVFLVTAGNFASTILVTSTLTEAIMFVLEVLLVGL